MGVALRDIARHLAARVTGPAEALGNPIRRLAAITDTTDDSLSFCTLKGTAARDALTAAKGGVLVAAEEAADVATATSATLLVVDHPRLAFCLASEAFFPTHRPRGIDASARISESAVLGPNVHVGPGAVVGADCTIGADVVIHANAVLYAGTVVGRRSIIHAGAVIGAPGFGYERAPGGRLVPFPQLGRVIIGDDVEIGANVCVDAGALCDTRIADGCKIDDLCYVAHNVTVGADSLLMAGSRLLGSSTVGRAAWIAPGAIVREGRTVGDDALLGMGAVATRDVPPGVVSHGVPARASGSVPET